MPIAVEDFYARSDKYKSKHLLEVHITFFCNLGLTISNINLKVLHVVLDA